jgi:ribosomal 50S subunit-recycling heat shock protein
LRIDKFLKVSRIIKRRTVAKEICDAGRVRLNGRPAKAGSELNIGDKLEIGYGARLLQVEVKELRDNVAAKEAPMLFTVLREERQSNEEWQ